jgi:hypothetical protein
MTKQKTVLTKVSKKVVPSKKKILAKKQEQIQKEEEKKRNQEIKDFDKSEKFLFACFDITDDTFITSIYPEVYGFFENYLQYYISKRRLFLAEMEKNKQQKEENGKAKLD